jgi:hypothetical protein
LKGDLIAAGSVSYATRNAAAFCGRVANISTDILGAVLCRPPADSEWKYQEKQDVVEEEEA